jgi:voltage-gated potassium channel
LGEIPYPFTDPQRLWATASIYGTVVAWLYGIGALFGILQDPLFRRILHENGVERAVRRIREPFYLICGYDDTGSRVARELAEDGARMVVIDIIPERVDTVEVDDLTFSVPALTGDASDPMSLVLAGLKSPHCAGVLALTGSDHINIKIALTARLLNPRVPVLAAARDHAQHARLAAAGADHIINPYDQFAERVATSIRTPSLQVIYNALTLQHGTAMHARPDLPKGRWLLCGSGLFTPIRPCCAKRGLKMRRPSSLAPKSTWTTWPSPWRPDRPTRRCSSWPGRPSSATHRSLKPARPNW